MQTVIKLHCCMTQEVPSVVQVSALSTCLPLKHAHVASCTRGVMHTWRQDRLGEGRPRRGRGLGSEGGEGGAGDGGGEARGEVRLQSKASFLAAEGPSGRGRAVRLWATSAFSVSDPNGGTLSGGVGDRDGVSSTHTGTLFLLFTTFIFT